MTTNGKGKLDELAQFIRETDGWHDMGAGALAEKICDKFRILADNEEAYNKDTHVAVPREPSEEMISAVMDELDRQLNERLVKKRTFLNATDICKAMLQANQQSEGE